MSNHTDASRTHHKDPIPSTGVIYFAKLGHHTLEFDRAKVTGKEVLEKGGKLPADEYDLYQYFVGGNRVKIELGDVVDLSVEGIEHFKTIRKKNTDGLMKLQEFKLPESDVKFLNGMEFDWSARTDGKRLILTIHQYCLPIGYNISKIDISFIIPSNFPESQIDMAYFYPHLERNDKIAIKSIATENIFGLVWQRWSRHRAPNEWVAGVDDVSTHFGFVESWIVNELKRGR